MHRRETPKSGEEEFSEICKLLGHHDGDGSTARFSLPLDIRITLKTNSGGGEPIGAISALASFFAKDNLRADVRLTSKVEGRKFSHEFCKSPKLRPMAKSLAIAQYASKWKVPVLEHPRLELP
ncbi:hypothetical protein Tco_0039962 [Tanacetum coccineum]